MRHNKKKAFILVSLFFALMLFVTACDIEDPFSSSINESTESSGTIDNSSTDSFSSGVIEESSTNESSGIVTSGGLQLASSGETYYDGSIEWRSSASWFGK